MTERSFQDHFSGHAAAYASARPTYPDALFDWIAHVAPGHGLAWDCAAGNGQASNALAARFDRVIATDGSAEQLANAIPRPRVLFAQAFAESAPFADDSIDACIVAQAAHWFDLPAFCAEFRRIAKPDAVLALWCYWLCSVSPAVDAVIERLYIDVVGTYWPPERKLIDDRYRTLELPFEELDAPTFDMRRNWTVDEMLAYLRTWSASERFRAATGQDPLLEVEGDLRTAWGVEVRQAVWPIHLRAVRASAN